MCRLQKFCFRFKLRTGAIVGAVLNAVIVVCLASLCAMYFSEANVFAKHENEDKKRDRLIKGSIKAIQAIVALIVLILFSIGINRGIAGFVLPWLIVSVILIVIGGVNTIIFLSVGHWALAAVWIAVYGFWFYLFIVVLSYYKSLKEEAIAAQTPIPLTQPMNIGPPPGQTPSPVDSKANMTPLYPSFPTELNSTPQSQQVQNNASHNLYPVQQHGAPPTYSQA